MPGYSAPHLQPRLVLTSPPRLRDTVFVLAGGRCVLGRAEGSHLRVDDPHVSRTHAALDRRPEGQVVEDLGSTGGTFINGRRIHGMQSVRHGDMLRFGAVEARYEELAGRGDLTMVGGAPVPAARPGQVPAGGSFAIGPQAASAINNVAGSQYNHIIQQRESFLREIAATRTRARRLVQFGLVLFLVGFGVGMWGFVRYSNAITSVGDQPPGGPVDGGFDFSGFQMGMIGAVVANVGIIVMVVGLVMHIVAASRTRRIDDQARRQLAPHPAW